MRQPRLRCADCGLDMNLHAEKVDWISEAEPLDSALGGAVEEVHACPGCGEMATRPAQDQAW